MQREEKIISEEKVMNTSKRNFLKVGVGGLLLAVTPSIVRPAYAAKINRWLQAGVAKNQLSYKETFTLLRQDGLSGEEVVAFTRMADGGELVNNEGIRERRRHEVIVSGQRYEIMAFGKGRKLAHVEAYPEAWKAGTPRTQLVLTREDLGLNRIAMVAIPDACRNCSIVQLKQAGLAVCVPCPTDENFESLLKANQP